MIDFKIFCETQIKRFFRWLTSNPPILKIFFNWLLVKKIGMKLNYFDDGEQNEHNKIFKEKNIQLKEEDNSLSVTNLGHATQLIQTSGINIITDPIFGNIAPVLYPSKIGEFDLNIKIDQIPKLDVILISHNHRDHVDEKSLRALIKNAKDKNYSQPHVFVPLGDGKYFRSLGFNSVQEFEWHEQVSIHSSTGKEVKFSATPADHRSGRKGYDAHKSLVLGWAISPRQSQEILCYAGDTSKISNRRMKSLALDIYELYRGKYSTITELPQIINMEPGGPNYSRNHMEPTHQSAVDSIVSAFRLSLQLESVSTACLQKMSAEKWLQATATVFMHHNKYELGPDRFNENVFICNRLISYIEMNNETLAIHKEKQEKKSSNWSLRHRNKSFIIDGIAELKSLAEKIWPDITPDEQKNKIVNFIKARIHFPLINEQLESEQLFAFNPESEQTSTIIPPTKKGFKHPKDKPLTQLDVNSSSTKTLSPNHQKQ